MEKGILSRKKEKPFSLLAGFLVVIALASVFMVSCQSKKDNVEKIGDNNIDSALVDIFALDNTIKANSIEISSRDGIVTLSGSVPDILSQKRAVKVAEALRGVRAVVNNIEVAPVFVPDEDLERNIRNSLLANPITENYQIDLKINGGDVVLSGSVDTWQEKKAAQMVVESIKGVKSVKNDLSVNFGDMISDAEILPEIERRIKMDPKLFGGLVKVAVKDAKVKLSGFVGSPAEKHIAYYDSWVKGVRDVDTSELKVDWNFYSSMVRENKPDYVNDDEIKKALNDALFYDPRVVSNDINVYVSNGSVTLSGKVENIASEKAALSDARNTAGVWKVTNRLGLEIKSPPTDAALLQNVSDALLWDPIVDRNKMDIEVNNGIVTLKGPVYSYFAKEHASDIVSRIKGVIKIDNQLEISPEIVKVPDQEIERNILKRYSWNYMLNPVGINVEVNQGIATLSGTVNNWEEYHAAVYDAFEGGAIGVGNRLEVRGEAARSDTLPQLFDFFDYMNF